jgi:predicted MFS family arabinose efflux permease
MGMLVNRLPARYLGAIGFILLATASVLTIYANSIFVMALSMAIFGLGIGGTMFLQNFLWADYFGRTHLGRIQGIVNPITLTIGGIGAPLAGYVRDSTGSYDSIWWAGVVLIVIGAVALAVTRPPVRRSMQ